MCGIFGYIGNRQANKIIIKGLKKLEYRGYDSAGLSVIFNNNIATMKCKGDVSTLEKSLENKDIKGTIGVGHTRWATHGISSEINAHPHTSEDGCFSIVHNGIIDNYLKLKSFAMKNGYKFKSDTDSEIIAALLQLLYNGDLYSTIKSVKDMLKGTFAVAIISSYTPDKIYTFKLKSPLHIGKGNDEFFVSSDIYAFSDNVNSYYSLDDGEIAIISKNIKFYDELGNIVVKSVELFSSDDNSDNLKGFKHYMIKEIFEQSSIIKRTVEEFNSKIEIIKNLSFENIYIVGCGSAYNAGILGASIIEQKCKIRAKAVVSSEYINNLALISCKDLLIAISQSGETADTLTAVREIKNRVGCKILSIVNVENSALERLSDYVLYTKAGKEVSVATTKCYFAQILLLLMISNVFTDDKFIMKDDIEKLSEMINDTLNLDVSLYIDKISKSNTVFFIGKGNDYYTALEASLKLKEVCYINAEAYPSGELKHGSIALVDDRTVVVMICTVNKYIDKNISAIKEITARGGYVLCIISEDCKDLKLYADDVIIIPSMNSYINSLISIVPLQLIAYNTAKQLCVNIDKPRNLAKSVTVE